MGWDRHLHHMRSAFLDLYQGQWRVHPQVWLGPFLGSNLGIAGWRADCLEPAQHLILWVWHFQLPGKRTSKFLLMQQKGQTSKQKRPSTWMVISERIEERDLPFQLSLEEIRAWRLDRCEWKTLLTGACENGILNATTTTNRIWIGNHRHMLQANASSRKWKLSLSLILNLPIRKGGNPWRSEGYGKSAFPIMFWSEIRLSPKKNLAFHSDVAKPVRCHLHGIIEGIFSVVMLLLLFSFTSLTSILVSMQITEYRDLLCSEVGGVSHHTLNPCKKWEPRWELETVPTTEASEKGCMAHGATHLWGSARMLSLIGACQETCRWVRK